MENSSNQFFEMLNQYNFLKSKNINNVYLCYNNITESYLITIYFSKDYIIKNQRFLEVIK